MIRSLANRIFQPRRTLSALYRQATEGDVGSLPKPSIFRPAERRLWKAWNALRGVSRAEAEEKYMSRLRFF